MTKRLSHGILYAVGAIAGILLVLTPTPANAGVDDVIKASGNIFGNLVMLVLQAIAWLIAQVTHFLIIIAQYSDFTRNQVVNEGWKIVVSVANMFFVVALLVIAIGTVLRIQNYRYTRLLGNVIVMAFLVNFSKTIAAFFIQSAQIIMLTFVNGFKDAAFGNFATMFGLDKVLTFSQTQEPSGFFDVFGAILIGLLFMTIACITVIAISIVLTVRVVYLWILVILSPLAYAMRVLPNTEQWASRWWSEFGKWVTTGPIIAFFLWLALAILSQSSASTGSTGTATSNFIAGDKSIAEAINAVPQQEVDVYFGGTKLLEIDQFISFIVAIAFLWTGLGMATSMGGVAGRWAGKVAAGGLAAYGVVSGLNALRDRTVRPVQGYFKQREQRRQATIQERAAWVGQAADKTISMTAGNVGRVVAGAKAGAGALLRGQTAAQAGQAATTAAKLGTRAQRQRDTREEAYVAGRIKARESEVALASPNISAADLEAMARGGDKDMAAAAVQELVRRNAEVLKKDEGIQLLRDTAAHLGQRNLGTNFMKSLDAVDPELARKTYFGDIRNRETVDKIKEALAARAVTWRILGREDLDYITEENQSLAEELSTFMENTSRNKEELKKGHDSINEDYRNAFFRRINMTGKSYEERKNVAEVTGQVSAAFRDDGKLMKDEVAQFFVYRGRKLNDIISSASAEDDELIHTLMKHEVKDAKTGKTRFKAGITEKELNEIQAKNEFVRNSLLTAMNGGENSDGVTIQGVYKRLVTDDGGAKWSLDDEGFKDQETMRRAIFKASKGKAILHDIGVGNVDAEEAFNRLAKSLQATDLIRLGSNEYFDKNNASSKGVFGDRFRKIVTKALGMRMNLKQLGDFATFGPAFYQIVKQSVKEAVDAGTAPGATTAETRRKRKLETNENTADLV